MDSREQNLMVVVDSEQRRGIFVKGSATGGVLRGVRRVNKRRVKKKRLDISVRDKQLMEHLILN